MFNRKFTSKVLGMILLATMLSGCAGKSVDEAQVQDTATEVEAAVEQSSEVAVVEAAVEATAVEEKKEETREETKEAATAATEEKSTEDKSSDEASTETSEDKKATEDNNKKDAANAQFEKVSDKVAYLRLVNGGKGSIKTDINCDGIEENLEYDFGSSDGFLLQSLTLTIDGKECVVPEIETFEAYRESPIHLFWFNTNGTKYIYIQSISFNDWKTIGVYSYAGDDLRLVDTIGGEVYFSFDMENDDYEYIKPADPEDFMLEGIESIFGTQYYTQRCRVGQNGLPEIIDGYRNYEVNNSAEIITLKSIPAIWIQDKYASAGERKSIPSGVKVTPVGSNGTSFVDLKIAGDDGIYRINIEKYEEEGWRLSKTEGLKGSGDYFSCFEGLPYWG